MSPCGECPNLCVIRPSPVKRVQADLAWKEWDELLDCVPLMEVREELSLSLFVPVESTPCFLPFLEVSLASQAIEDAYATIL